MGCSCGVREYVEWVLVAVSVPGALAVLCAVFTFSAWAPVMFLFPFLAPLVRLLAFALPDKGLLRMKAARGTIVNAVGTLIQEHRHKLEVVLCSQSSRQAGVQDTVCARQAVRVRRK